MGEGRDFDIGNYLTRELADAVSLTKDHLVLEIDGNGKLILGTAAGVPYAVASRSTQNKVARTAGITSFDSGADRKSGIPILRSGIVELPLGSTNLAIAIGDRIVVHADNDGTVNGAGDEDTTSAATLLADQKGTVGFSEEVKGVDEGGTVLVALKLYKGGAP